MVVRISCLLTLGLISAAAGFAAVPQTGPGASARSPSGAGPKNALRRGLAAQESRLPSPDGDEARASAGFANAAAAILAGALGGLLLAASSANATLDDVATTLPYDLSQRIERLEKWRELAKRVEELEAAQLKALDAPAPAAAPAPAPAPPPPPPPPPPPAPKPKPKPKPAAAPSPAPPAAQKEDQAAPSTGFGFLFPKPSKPEPVTPPPKPVAPAPKPAAPKPPPKAESVASKPVAPANPATVVDEEDDSLDLSDIIPQTKVWSYKDAVGWKSAGYPMCAEGKEQSPIDLDEDRAIDVKANGTLASRVNYKPLQGLKIFNNENRNVQVNGDFGSMTLPDGVYDAFQFHFHFPAEHEVGGKRAAGELHIVHQKRGAKGTDGLAVVGILLEETKDADSAGLPETQFMEKLYFRNQLPKKGEKKQVEGDLDLRAFRSEFKGGYYHYIGSLTTPPCSEKVHWYVLEEPAYVTKDMIRSYKKLFPSNNRPVQPLNEREMTVSDVALPNEFLR